MTTLSRNIERQRRRAAPGVEGDGARVVVRWRAMRAGLAHLPGIDGAGAPGNALELRCVVEMMRDGRWRGAMEIESASEDALPRCAGVDGRIEHDSSRNMWHISAPGFLVATLRRTGAGAWDALYVNSAAVAKLEMPGGWCEATGGALEEIETITP